MVRAPGTGPRRAAAPPRQIASDALGASYDADAIAGAIDAVPGVIRLDGVDALDEAAGRLADGEVCGWFQGGSELGPRALGQRSILCDARQPGARLHLNARIKGREPFRPFAPAILAGHVADWFDLGGAPADSPFMLRVLPFRPDKAAEVPAVVHADGSGRLQTVSAENGPFHVLLERFHRLTGVPLLLNTSFNVMGEPIVETPADALWCMLEAGLRACVLGETLVVRDPAFDSILDLAPVATWRPVGKAGPGGQGLVRTVADTDLIVAADTCWGESRIAVDAEAPRPMALIDGRRTGRMIAAMLGEEIGEAADERRLTRLLCRLRRAGAVRLEEGS